MPERGIDEATDLALANPYWNPRPLERQGIRKLIARAWAGEGPRVEGSLRLMHIRAGEFRRVFLGGRL